MISQASTKSHIWVDVFFKESDFLGRVGPERSDVHKVAVGDEGHVPYTSANKQDAW